MECLLVNMPWMLRGLFQNITWESCKLSDVASEVTRFLSVVRKEDILINFAADCTTAKEYRRGYVKWDDLMIIAQWTIEGIANKISRKKKESNYHSWSSFLDKAGSQQIHARNISLVVRNETTLFVFVHVQLWERRGGRGGCFICHGTRVVGERDAIRHRDAVLTPHPGIN